MKAYVLANTYILMFIALLSATKNLERTKISINYAVDIQQDSSVNINWSEKKKNKYRDKTWLSGAGRKDRKWGTTADGYKVYWGKGVIFFRNYFMRLAAQLL